MMARQMGGGEETKHQGREAERGETRNS